MPSGTCVTGATLSQVEARAGDMAPSLVPPHPPEHRLRRGLQQFFFPPPAGKVDRLAQNYFIIQTRQQPLSRGAGSRPSRGSNLFFFRIIGSDNLMTRRYGKANE